MKPAKTPKLRAVNETENSHATNNQDELVAWLDGLENRATNSATNPPLSGTWVELVKVKKWYSLRLMRWDATNKRKVYVRYIGTLEKIRNDRIYGDEAKRLERRRFTIDSGAIVVDMRSFKQNAINGS